MEAKKPTAKKPVAKVAPVAAAPVEAVEAVEAEEAAPATEVTEESAPEEVAPPIPSKPTPKGAVTTTQNFRTVGEVSIPQPSETRVDVSHVKKNDIVMITMHETIDPAPRVGTFDARHELGVQALRERKNYRVPKFFAEVLVDAKKAEYLSVE